MNTSHDHSLEMALVVVAEHFRGEALARQTSHESIGSVERYLHLESDEVNAGLAESSPRLVNICHVALVRLKRKIAKHSREVEKY